MKNSSDVLNEGGLKASAALEATPENYSGSGGDAVPLCPLNCP